MTNQVDKLRKTLRAEFDAYESGLLRTIEVERYTLDCDHFYGQYRCPTCGSEAFRVYAGAFKTGIECSACNILVTVHIG